MIYAMNQMILQYFCISHSIMMDALKGYYFNNLNVCQPLTLKIQFRWRQYNIDSDHKSQCLFFVSGDAKETTLSRDNFWWAESGSKVKSLVSFVWGMIIRAKSVKSETFFSRRARRRIDIVVFGSRFLISRKLSWTWVLISFGRPDWWRMEYSTSYLIFGQPCFSHLIVTLNILLSTGCSPEVICSGRV